MNWKIWVTIAIACIVGLGGLVVFTKNENAINIDGIDPARIITANGDTLGDRVFGNPDAKVVLIEYADFQCPGCAAAHTATQQVRSAYKDKIAFIFRSFPITTAHPNALAASTAAEAAGQQGKFWEMHDLLYQERDSWADASGDKRGDVFTNLARRLGLNTDTFIADQGSKAVSQKIARDRALADKVGVDKTPSFFIGAEKVNADIVSSILQQQSDKLMDALDAALKAAGETPPTRP